MTKEEAIESFKCSNEQAKLRLEVEKKRMDSGEIKELEFYIERDEMAIKALEQEQCGNAISRQAVLDYIDKMPSELTSDGRRMVRRRSLEEYISDTLPPVIPQPKAGWWIYKQYGSYPEQGDYHCSECDGIDNRIPAYCPNCGAKMQEVEE